MSSEPVALDRRQRRRRETIEEVIDVAVEVMAEQGVAGLSVGEVARRMGIRPPSLYVYFPSKNALYDALFARGAALIRDTVASSLAVEDDDRPLEDILRAAADVYVRWAMEHPAYTQLLFWRPVPGYQPSETAYAPAVEMSAFSLAKFTALQRRGLLRSDVDVEQIFRAWTVLVAGVVSQQLSNAPHESFEDGTFSSVLPDVVAMFAAHYAAPNPSPARRRAHRAHQR